MSTMGVPYVGERGAISYGAPLISNGTETGLLQRNTAIPDEMFYTFATGRFATRRLSRSQYRVLVDISTSSASIHRYEIFGWGDSEYSSLKNIPIYGAVSDDIIGCYRPSGNYKLPTTNNQLTAQLGMTIPNSIDVGNAYTINTPRGVSNWKYNNVAAAVKVQGVYWKQGMKGFLRGNLPTANIKNFLFDFSLIPSTYADTPLVGYNLIYDLIGGQHNAFYNTMYIATLRNTMGNTGDSEYIGDTDYGKESNPFDYCLSMGNILIGSTFDSMNSDSYITGAIGPEKFEGIDLVTEHDGCILYNDGTNNFTGSLFWWSKSVIQSGVFIESDFARFALQLGLPVVTSAEAETAFVRGGADYVLDQELLKDDLYYPIIANGKIDGENYLRGDQIPRESKLYKLGKEQDNHNLSDEDMPNVSDGTGTWEPTNPDENTYVEEIELNTPKVTPVGIFSRWYALTEYDVIDLFNFLYTADDSVISRIKQGLTLNGENPMDFLIGLRMFPFALNDFIDTMSSENIGFGNGVDTGVVAERITGASFILDLGSCTFRKYFNNFLDYEPYTTAKLYIPFCGEINVETALFVGHKISVKMIVDLTTGTCCAVIYRDGIPCMYQDGNMASEVQITGTNSTEYVNMAKSALGKVITGSVELATQTFGKGATSHSESHNVNTDVQKQGRKILNKDIHSKDTERNSWSTPSTRSSVTMAGSSLGKMIEGAYEWHNMPTPLGISGNSTALTELFKPQYCYFIVEQAVVISTNNYGNSYGYACLEYGKISALADGTLVAAKNVNITPPNATLPEISEIKELLESGVWK